MSPRTRSSRCIGSCISCRTPMPSRAGCTGSSRPMSPYPAEAAKRDRPDRRGCRHTDRRGECARPGRGQTAIGAPDPRDRSAPGVRADRNTHALLRAPLTCGNRSPAEAAAQDHQEPTPRSPRSTQNFVDPTDPDARAARPGGPPTAQCVCRARAPPSWNSPSGPAPCRWPPS